MGQAVRQTQTPSDWLEEHFYVPDPRDPITGAELPNGPIRLAKHQKRIIDEALSRKPDGSLKYSTVIFSAPKKSGKSALTSGVMLYFAFHNPNSYVACIANDGKQSTDRLYAPVYTNFRLHRQLGGIFREINPNKNEVILDNFTKIEPIPCDAAGEAGSQPVFTAWSELWGFETDTKRRVWTELTIPPTLYGRAMRWVETYAGYTGQSTLLEQLYETGFKDGTPHPDFLDLQGQDGPVVRVNDAAGMFVYWDTEPRMLWQSEDYYAVQAKTMPAAEFRRIHRNQWVSPSEAFIQEAWWEACEDINLPALADGDKTPVVVAIDMAVSRDCAALVATTRDPWRPDSEVAVRGVRIFSPKEMGSIIDQERDIRPVIEDWHSRWNVVCWTYDPHQMAKLAQDMTREGYGWFKPFGQGDPRAIADKELHDAIMARQVSWNRHTTEGQIGIKNQTSESLFKHLSQAGAKVAGDKYRIEKLADSAKIDAAVALSMARHVTMQLAIGNRERDEGSLIEKLRRREITVEEFSRMVREQFPKLKEKPQNDGQSRNY